MRRFEHPSFLLVLALLPLLASCTGPRGMPVETAFAKLSQWDGLTATDALKQDIAISKEKFLSYQAVLHQVEGAERQIFIVHVGWTVGICLLDQDLNVLSAQSFQAKLGFSVRTEPGTTGCIVTLHKHPGTGLFEDMSLSVMVVDGKIRIQEIEKEG